MKQEDLEIKSISLNDDEDLQSPKSENNRIRINMLNLYNYHGNLNKISCSYSLITKSGDVENKNGELIIKENDELRELSLKHALG